MLAKRITSFWAKTRFPVNFHPQITTGSHDCHPWRLKSL
jgi:hypothetical protein